MPYELAFTKVLQPKNPDQYFNDCCYGGDLVLDQILPRVKAGRSDIQSNQEDWGWFVWSKQGAVSLTADIFCDDPAKGRYRILLGSTVKRFGVFETVKDTPELDALLRDVTDALSPWITGPFNTTRVTEDGTPIEGTA